ncbi:MAG TPA: YihY family inner membrane protein [Burkholderiales bacterium]|jgi:membrane protein|nr:YihY family inner membrane protein [Burkholderiales bacterium]
MRLQLRQLGRFFAHLLRRFDQDHCLQIASSLTFTTLLALVPLVTITLTLMSAFPVFSGLGEHIRAFLLANMLPEKAGNVVSGYIEQFSGRAGRLTAVGTVFLAVTAFMMMFTMERAFNSIWRVSRPRPLAQRILIYWAALTLAPILIGASLSITSYLVGASLGLTRETPLAGTAILWLVPFALTWAAFTLVYYFVPNRAIRPRHALIGGLVAAFVFEIMKRSFAVFVAQIPTYSLVYGAFAVFPIFLLWVYFSWVVVVIGALITALAPDFAVLRDKAGSAVGAGFGDALATLLVLAQAQQGAQVLDLRSIARSASLPVDQAERLLDRMAAHGWVARSGREKYAMVCDKERLLVGDVYREFVLDGRSSSGKTRSEALEKLMAQFVARADEALNLPLGRLLEEQRA